MCRWLGFWCKGEGLDVGEEGLDVEVFGVEDVLDIGWDFLVLQVFEFVLDGFVEVRADFAVLGKSCFWISVLPCFGEWKGKWRD